MGTRFELILPDLGLNGTPLVVSSWLVARGDQVSGGDRVVEILAGSVTVDLPAPASGSLAELRVVEDEQVRPGQVLAIIEQTT